MILSISPGKATEPLLFNLELGEKNGMSKNLWAKCFISCIGICGALHVPSGHLESGYRCSCTLQLHDSVRVFGHLTMWSFFHLVLARLFTHQTFHWADSSHSLKTCLPYWYSSDQWVEFLQHRVRRVLNIRQRGGRRAGQLGAEGRRKDREEDVVSDRQMSRNPVLTSHI